MTYEEYSSWKTFYSLEPFGWHDREYRTSMILAMLLNLNVTKVHRKSPNDFYRDMLKIMEDSKSRQNHEEEMREKYRNASPKERARIIAMSLGGEVKEK